MSATLVPLQADLRMEVTAAGLADLRMEVTAAGSADLRMEVTAAVSEGLRIDTEAMVRHRHLLRHADIGDMVHPLRPRRVMGDIGAAVWAV